MSDKDLQRVTDCVSYIGHGVSSICFHLNPNGCSAGRISSRIPFCSSIAFAVSKAAPQDYSLEQRYTYEKHCPIIR
jgi:hypothetical protein